MISPLVKVQDLLPLPDSEYVNYAGSLTTPTCNEAVRWILFKQPIQISASQMEAFRALKDKGDMPIVDNYRWVFASRDLSSFDLVVVAGPRNLSTEESSTSTQLDQNISK